jgi:toxin ParE1/3/4
LSFKPVVPRGAANRDVREALSYYLTETSQDVALGFIDALEQAFAHIARSPSSGSPRYAHELNLPGLRTWRLRRYPYLVFYVDRADHVDVWRILHGERDIPGWLRSPSPLK